MYCQEFCLLCLSPTSTTNPAVHHFGMTNTNNNQTICQVPLRHVLALFRCRPLLPFLHSYALSNMLSGVSPTVRPAEGNASSIHHWLQSCGLLLSFDLLRALGYCDHCHCKCYIRDRYCDRSHSSTTTAAPDLLLLQLLFYYQYCYPPYTALTTARNAYNTARNAAWNAWNVALNAPPKPPPNTPSNAAPKNAATNAAKNVATKTTSTEPCCDPPLLLPLISGCCYSSTARRFFPLSQFFHLPSMFYHSSRSISIVAVLPLPRTPFYCGR